MIKDETRRLLAIASSLPQSRVLLSPGYCCGKKSVVRPLAGGHRDGL
jgi:hypothetical protein